MLNGVAPIIIFHFNPLIVQNLLSGFAGIPVIGGVLSNLGIPIPIYLDQNLTGIYVDTETKAIDVTSDVQISYDPKVASAVDQRGLNNIVTINLFASKTSIMLSVLLAMNDMIFQRLVSKTYSISYLNGTTTIFNGLLHGFSTSVGSDDDLIRIVMQIEKSNLKPPTPGGATLINPALSGAQTVVVPSSGQSVLVPR